MPTPKRPSASAAGPSASNNSNNRTPAFARPPNSGNRYSGTKTGGGGGGGAAAPASPPLSPHTKNKSEERRAERSGVDRDAHGGGRGGGGGGGGGGQGKHRRKSQHHRHASGGDRDEDGGDRRRRRQRSSSSSPRKQTRNRGESGSPNKMRPHSQQVGGNGHESESNVSSSGQALSMDSLAKLNAINEKARMGAKGREEVVDEKKIGARKHQPQHNQHRHGNGKRKKRVVSGALLEEGRGGGTRVRTRGGRGDRYEKDDDGDGGGGGRGGGTWSRRKKLWVWVGVVVVLLIIIIPVAVVESNKNGGSDDDNSSGTDSSDGGDKSGLDGIDPDSIPASAKGTVLDPFTWYDTTDFNCTYTNETVGGLSVMGLKSSWDDSAQANEQVPPLNEPFPFGKRPIRGVNVGGWLSLEPFITPSIFNQFKALDGVVDEWTLTQKLGPNAAAQQLEKHYATFFSEQTFQDIRDAGMDHVRIPYSYWAVTTYDGDPYVPKISWRYLLRGIEYCRKYGLRVKLDLHGLPGSQNGWNHSGRQGAIGWLNGTDGQLNAQRSLDIHRQLSTFFAQDRYKNVITMYGLANEPKMIKLPVDSVLEWTRQAVDIVRGNGMKQVIVFGDGFLGLENWHGKLQGVDDDMVLDAHQYVIFNTGQIRLPHKEKIDFACSGWGAQMSQSNDPSTGWGPTICGEWSQADTDCARYLNNVNVGSRWTGTLNTQDPSTQVLSPTCPESDSPCDCDPANADPSSYSAQYKKFLQTFAEAQMSAFEKAWGWFYWTWQTEDAVQWSWKSGLEAGILPQKAYEPDFKCGDDIPSLGNLPENY